MSKITRMQALRERMLKAIEDFEDGKIDSSQLAALSKATESIISGLRSEMQYAVLTNQKPCISFFGEGSGIALEKNEIKRLI